MSVQAARYANVTRIWGARTIAQPSSSPLGKECWRVKFDLLLIFSFANISAARAQCAFQRSQEVHRKNGISAVDSIPDFHMFLTARYQLAKAGDKESRCVALQCSLHKIKVHSLQIITAYSLFDGFFRVFCHCICLVQVPFGILTRENCIYSWKLSCLGCSRAKSWPCWESTIPMAFFFQILFSITPTPK